MGAQTRTQGDCKGMTVIPSHLIRSMRSSETMFLNSADIKTGTIEGNSSFSCCPVNVKIWGILAITGQCYAKPVEGRTCELPPNTNLHRPQNERKQIMVRAGY